MDDFEQELKVGFLDEAGQAVADVEQCFLALETDPKNQENLNKIFRLAHNLKGSSKAVGFDAFGEFTHQFESLILKVKNLELDPTAEVINLLLRANDHVSKMVSGLKENLNATFDSENLLLEMRQIKNSESEEKKSPLQEETKSVEMLPEEVSQDEEKFIKVQSQEPAEALPFELEKPTKPILKNTPVADESIRVGLGKVEHLINFVGEMVILQSVLREQIAKSDSLLLKKTIHHLGKVSKEIQDIAMGLRMVPVKPTFQKMQRIVRDTAQALEKDVSIQLQGEETELDKTVLEKINDPLVHLIRNSVDHGIEKSAVRVARGKPEKGQVYLRAFHRSGKLVLEVEDDGGGLDVEVLKKKALEKNIIKATDVLTEKEALNLIFAPGFSTKEKVTDVSGRGVGMDVVKTNIQELGGEIEIENSIGKGSKFRVILPLTLAIVDAMVLLYSGERFVIPLNHVFETLRPDAKILQKNAALGEVLLLRGENLPLIRLGDFFGLKSSHSEYDMIAIVIRTTPKPFAILVDDILGQYQVVQKQLGPELQGFKGVSGSTILGDGRPALILEPQDLIKRKVSSQYQEINKTKISGGKAA